MQLVYVWIKKSENDFIENKGFNFYGEHNFELIEKSDKSFQLIYKKRDSIGSDIFKSTRIKNITAIVGGNGSGKTTLIEELKLLESEEYKGEFLQVFKDNDLFYYYTNILSNFEVDFKKDSNIDITKISEYPKHITSILTSNSSYINHYHLWDYTLFQIEEYGNRFYKMLFRNTVHKSKKSKEEYLHKKAHGHPNTQYDFLEELYDYDHGGKNLSERFQAFCDLLFYYDVFKNKKEFLGKRKLEISFEIQEYSQKQFEWLPMIKNLMGEYLEKYHELGKKLYSQCLVELCEERLFNTREIEYYFYALQEKENIKKILIHKKINVNLAEIIIPYLATNLNFKKECNEQILKKVNVANNIHKQFCSINNIPYDKEELYEKIEDILEISDYCEDNKDEMKKLLWIDSFKGCDSFKTLLKEQQDVTLQVLDLSKTIEKYLNDFLSSYDSYEKDKNFIWKMLMELNKDKTTPEMKRYFENALVEIKDFIEIIQNNTIFPISEYQGKKLMDYIGKQIIDVKENPSFVLRHINKINGFEMSSGERAMTNLFSWIHTIPRLTQLIPEKQSKIENQGSIILLIDEIDLYAHPEWQRKLVNVLCESVSTVFENNQVQVILTTHSPFVLSDLPKGNVIYLKEKKENSHFTLNSLSTFGANIHTLLQDSFFMNYTMGEFSRTMILKLNDNLKRKTPVNSEEYEMYDKQIKAIGEPVIRNYLEEELIKLLPKKEKIAKLEYQLKCLKGE